MPDAWDYSQPRQSPASNLTQLPLITTLLCAACVLVTLASWTGAMLSNPVWTKIGRVGDIDPSDLWSGHWWGLITPFFPHGNIPHIVFNMLWLFGMGRLMEARLNPIVYVLFLAAAAAVGTASELLVSSSTGIGASGVVYAMFGLMYAGRGRYPEWTSIATGNNLRIFILWALFCMATTALHVLNIANGAHIGGFVFGLSMGWLLAAPRRQPIWALALAGLLSVNILALTWQPWSADWTWWKASREYHRAHYQNSVYWYKRTLAQGSDPHNAGYNLGLAWEGVARDALKHNNPDKAKQAREQAEQAFSNAGPDTDDNP